MQDLPDQWCFAKVGELIDFGPKNDCPDDTDVGFVPLARLGVSYRSHHSFEAKKWREVKKGYTHFADGDVLLAKITPSFENGKAGIVRGLPSGLGAGSTEYFVCRPVPGGLLSEYLLAHFKTPKFLQDGEQLMSGAVGQQRVPKQYVLDSLLPLAPFNEQRRIAHKLEAVLARLDACRERLDRVPAILKRFRQSVLAAATSGKLTEEWREENSEVTAANQLLANIAEERERQGLTSARRASSDEEYSDADPLPNGWAWCSVGQIADVRLGGTPSRKEPRYWNGDVPWVSSGQVANCRITDTTEKITQAGLAESNAKLYPPGSVLIAMIGEGKTRGQSAILDVEATTNQNSAGLVFDGGNVVEEYVWLWALGEYEATRGESRGGAQPALNGAKVRALSIPLPPLEEQEEIAQRARKLLDYADRLENSLRVTRSKVEDLTSSLLARAFRGELVPQDPNDETASALLERIRAERAAAQRARKSKRGSRASTKKKSEVGMLSGSDIEDKHLSDILKERGPLTAEALWSASQLEIDDFYDQLKAEEERGLLVEKRGESPTAPRMLEAAA